MKGEYNNCLFRGILRATGIQYEPAPPYTQNKNGVRERTIRTITTKARALLLDARLPAEFWAEAIQTAVYLHARSPSQSNKGKTPFEMIYHEKPELYHLRRFGCLACKLVPVPKCGEKKFGCRSQECIILGYMHQTTKIWRLWNPSTKQVIQASDARFGEERLVSLVAGTDVLRTVLQENQAMNTVWFDDDDNNDDDNDRDLDFTMVGDVVEDGSPGIEMLDNGVAGRSSPGTLDSRTVIEREGEVVDQDFSHEASTELEELHSTNLQLLESTEEVQISQPKASIPVEPSPAIITVTPPVLRHFLRKRHVQAKIAAMVAPSASDGTLLDPSCYEEAVEFKCWQDAMREGFASAKINPASDTSALRPDASDVVPTSCASCASCTTSQPSFASSASRPA